MNHMLLICESSDRDVRDDFSEFVTSSCKLLGEASGLDAYALEVKDSQARIAGAIRGFLRVNPQVQVRMLRMTRHT